MPERKQGGREARNLRRGVSSDVARLHHKFKNLFGLGTLAIAFQSGTLVAQVTLNPAPSRVLGHPQLALTTGQPNWIEGRELNSPQGIAIDTGASPPTLYVSDTANNRVLVWRRADAFTAGAPADLVIGQRDRFSTLALGPGTTLSTGLSAPTGLAVRGGYLYIADTGNHRVLRFPNPLLQTEIFPDLVIGQPSFNSRTANSGGLSSRSLSLTGGRADLAFDRNGNLYVTDPGNRRVLRFPETVLGPAARPNPTADLVLGQPDFVSATPLAGSAQNLQIRDRLVLPSGVAVDSRGGVYIADADPSRPNVFSRVLVFDANAIRTGAAATRILGVIATSDTPQAAIDQTVMISPSGMALVNDSLVVADTFSHRILIFPPRDQWPAEALALSPQAQTVIGQAGFSGRAVNRGLAEPSAETLFVPTAVAVSGTEIFVADTGNNRVLAFASPYTSAARLLGQTRFNSNAVNMIEGREMRFVGPRGNGTLSDAAVLIDRRGETPYLYIADPHNHRVLGFRDARKAQSGDIADLVIGQPDFFRALCNYPTANPDTPNESGLCYPVGLALDSDGNLYVADAGNSRIVRFPKPFASGQSFPRADLVLGQRSFDSRITDPSSRTMSFPSGLALTADGLVATDSAHNRVLFFAGAPATFSNGMAATRVIGQPDFGSTASGSPDNRFNAPADIATDAAGRLYVADTGNNRVLIFNPQATQDIDPRAAVIISDLSGPRGVFVSPSTGDIWVASTGNGRTLRYLPFERLSGAAVTPAATITSSAGPLAVTTDLAGALFVADAANRVAIYFPAVSLLNAANYIVGRPLAPGAIASAFAQGSQFSRQTAVFNELPQPLPMPRQLAGVEVLLNQKPVPLFFVSPGQINFQVPVDAPETGTADLVVRETASGQVLAAGTAQMAVASPGLFTLNARGSGPVAAVNEDGSINSATNPARPGVVVSLYATGYGNVAGAPQEGNAAQGIIETSERPRILINNVAIPEQNVLFSGLAPGFVGLWQINFRVPDDAAPGNALPIVILYKSIPSNNLQNPAEARATLSIRP